MDNPFRLNVRLVLALACVWIAISCDSLLQVEFDNDPEGNFEALWHEFDRYYALFGIRTVDWDSLYTVYRPRVGPESTERELYDVMTDLLSNLKDGHVSLAADGFPRYSGYADTNRALFPDSSPDSNAVDRSAMYWNAVYEYMDSVYVGSAENKGPKGYSFWGTISDRYTTLQIGYAALYHFDTLDDLQPFYREFKKAFDGYDGVIIDLRTNRGGFRCNVEGLLGIFVKAETPYVRRYCRNGPDHDDLTVGSTLTLEPGEYSLAGIPIVVLTTRFSISAAEFFVMGSMALPQSIVVGDTTSGAFGTVVKKVLPNGWEFTLSPNLVTDMEGVSYEGVGIPPDIRVLSTKAGIDQGIDAALDAAITALESGLQ